ncbi:hypothetical protein RO3G_04627 [Lichtheimia corymbifera JMRC:FSU:9682]|uniref:Uncharacterized protein n=1 Tax=Lichtheimia corymbifera JMRC:FSU:9682 TaxID=1263082 RepID=A0A068RZH3_9FUNG|nr:hypothetical protein RO3G_04627 [Lichtheimia corymbifera JMRC:FSU:9682]
MTFAVGYEMESMPGRVVPPPLLHDKISLTSSGNTSRWVFYGTRKQIIDWMREHANLVVEYNLFNDKQHHENPPTELVFDLHYLHDSEQSYYNYVKSFFVSDYEHERVKVEIRPKLDSKDHDIQTMCRVYTRSSVRLGDVVDELEHQWHQPARSYYQQAVDAYNDSPGPSHVLSSVGPSSIRVGQDPSVQVERPSQPAAAVTDEK